jgi:hypothetical protein
VMPVMTGLISDEPKTLAILNSVGRLLSTTYHRFCSHWKDKNNRYEWEEGIFIDHQHLPLVVVLKEGIINRKWIEKFTFQIITLDEILNIFRFAVTHITLSR